MGFFANMFRGEKVDTSAATLKPQGVKLIDVRSRGEYKSGHFAGARNLDVGGFDFAQGIKRLNPAHTYLVYCQSGNPTRCPHFFGFEQAAWFFTTPSITSSIIRFRCV